MRLVHTALRRLLLFPTLPGDRVHDIRWAYGWVLIPRLLGFFPGHGFRVPTKYHNCTMTGIH